MLTTSFAVFALSFVVRPLGAIFRVHLPTLRRGFILAAALSCAFNLWFVFLPAYLGPLVSGWPPVSRAPSSVAPRRCWPTS